MPKPKPFVRRFGQVDFNSMVALPGAAADDADIFVTRRGAFGTNRTLTRAQIISGAGGVPDPLLLNDGAVGAPTYSFSSDPNTGVYREAADILGFAAGGVQIAQAKEVIGANQFIVAPGVVQNAPATPSLAFGDGDSGFFESVDDTLNLALGSGNRYIWTAGSFSATAAEGPAVLNEASLANNPTLVPRKTDPDTGIASAAADQLSLVAGSIESLRFTELNSGVVQVPAADVTITAFAGGGQGSAVALKQSYNVLSVVAADGHSVKLPAVFAVNSIIYVKNDGANRAAVFPASGDDLGLGTDVAQTVAAGRSLSYIATVANSTWTPSATIPDPFQVPDGSEANPSLAFLDDTGTGFYRAVGPDIRVTFGATDAWQLSPGSLGSTITNMPALLGSAASATVPNIVPNKDDVDTGIGAIQADAPVIIAGGETALGFLELDSGVVQFPAADVAITALAGGGQGGAGALKQSYNVISVAATTGDSVTLPASFFANSLCFIKNDGANSVDVFPAAGDDLGQGTNVAEALAAGAGIVYIATVLNATWTPLIS